MSGGVMGLPVPKRLAAAAQMKFLSQCAKLAAPASEPKGCKVCSVKHWLSLAWQGPQGPSPQACRKVVQSALGRPEGSRMPRPCWQVVTRLRLMRRLRLRQRQMSRQMERVSGDRKTQSNDALCTMGYSVGSPDSNLKS